MSVLGQNTEEVDCSCSTIKNMRILVTSPRVEVMSTQSVWPAASAIATTFASFTALYVGVFRPKRLTPSLLFLCADEDPYAISCLVHPNEEANAWLRLRVLNRQGRRSAEGVQVVIVEARQGSDASPMPLLVGRTVKWTDRDAATSELPPGVPMHVDILRLKVTYADQGALDASVALYPPPTKSRRDILDQDSVHLVLALSARDVPAQHWSVEIDLDRSWDGSEWGSSPPPMRVRSFTHLR